MIVAIDIGFGDTKVFTPQESFKFPSAIAPVQGLKDDFFSSADIYEYQGRMFIVGEQVLIYKNCFSTRSTEFVFRYAPILLYSAVKKLSSIPREVVTGLPLSTFLDRAKRDEFGKKIARLVVNGEVLNFDVSVFAEGHGIFVDYALDEKGEPIDRERIRETALVIDIGFFTVDVLTITQGFPTREGSTTFEEDGISKICERLSDYIQKNYSFTLREQAVKDVLLKKRLSIYGSEKDLTGIIEDIVSEYVEWLLQEVQSRWDGFLKRADRLIIAGGGAYYVKEFLPEKYRGFVFIPEKPEYSNARGFYKFLRAQRNEKAHSNA